MISAGGVAYRKVNDAVEIALIKTASEGRWQLPKGIVDPGETLEQAALREVREEAGIECEIVAPIETIDYWYVDRYGTQPFRVHKHVHFFLLKYIAGDVTDHDGEVVEARWIESGEAAVLLSFEKEKAIVKNALHSIL